MKISLSWLPAALFAAAIFLSSHYLEGVPAVFPKSYHEALDVIAHVGLYFCLGLFLARYLSTARGYGTVEVVVIAGASCLAFGIFDELHQMFIEGRSAQFTDLVVDVAGGVIGALVYDAGTNLSKALNKDTEVHDRSRE